MDPVEPNTRPQSELSYNGPTGRKGVLPLGWVACPSKTYEGKVYYFNVLTGCNLWECPALLPPGSTSDTLNPASSASSTSSISSTKLSKPSTSKIKSVKTEKKVKTDYPVKKHKSARRVKESDKLENGHDDSSQPDSEPEFPSSTHSKFSGPYKPFTPPKEAVAFASSLSIALGKFVSPKGVTVLDDDDVMEVEVESPEKYPEIQDVEMIDIMNLKPSNSTENKEAFHIVIDTNILIHDLDFVDELKDTPLEGYGLPIIVVPWVVLQELDSLKNPKNFWRGTEHTQNTARQSVEAIRYLNNKLQTRHPRIKGQLADQGKNDFLATDCADDKILHCAWQLEKTVNKVVLLTNDRNLANKSMVQGISANSAEKFYQYFQPDDWLHKKVEKSNGPKNSSDSDHRQTVDEIICKVKALLKFTLTDFLETEMKSVYKNDWLSMFSTSMTPPWTLLNTLELILKHWSAVFSFVLTKDAQSHIDQIRNILRISNGYIVETTVALQVVNSSISLLRQVLDHSGSCHDQFRHLETLYDELKDLRANTQAATSSHSYLQTFFPHLSKDFSKNILGNLQYLWSTLTALTGAIFDSFEIQHDFLYDAPPNKRVQKSDSLDFLPKLFAVLQHLRRSIIRILILEDTGGEDFKIRVKEFNLQLTQAFKNLNSKVSFPEKFTVEELQVFCSKKDHRNLLESNKLHLDKLIAVLHECIVSLTMKDK